MKIGTANGPNLNLAKMIGYFIFPTPLLLQEAAYKNDN